MRLIVWKRTPFALPLRRMERFASVMPTHAQSSFAVMPRARSAASRCTSMAMGAPPFLNDAVAVLLQRPAACDQL